MGKMPCNTPSAQNTSPYAPEVSARKQRIHGKKIIAICGFAI
jgi:hypothetical protein